MRKRGFLKRLSSILLAIILAIIVPFGEHVYAASDYVTESIVETDGFYEGDTRFDNCIRVGNVIYFSTGDSFGMDLENCSGIISYNIKTKKTKQVSSKPYIAIKYYKGYLYGCTLRYKNGFNYTLYRINVKTGKETKLIGNLYNDLFVIYKNKIYVSGTKKISDMKSKESIYSISLNGSKKSRIATNVSIADNVFSTNGTPEALFGIHDGKVFYFKLKNGSDLELHSYNISTKTDKKLLNTDCTVDYIDNTNIYYTDNSGETRYVKAKLDGTVIKKYKKMPKSYKTTWKNATACAKSSSAGLVTRSEGSNGSVYECGNKKYYNGKKGIMCMNKKTKSSKCIYKYITRKTYKGEAVTENNAGYIVGVVGNYIVVAEGLATKSTFYMKYELINSSGKLVTTLYTRTGDGWSPDE
jgi:hypothetical protein